MPITSYLNQTVNKKVTKAYDVYGTPQAEIPQYIKCRIQSSSKRLIGQGGTEFNADAEMWVKPAERIDVDDVITWEGEDYKVVRVDVKKNVVGATNHKKCFLVVNRQ